MDPTGAADAVDQQVQAAFDQAAAEVVTLPERPAGDDLLELYSLYKQAQDGDCGGDRPGFTDFVGRAKHDAWTGLAGMSREAAMRAYVRKVEELKAAGGN